MKSDFFSYLDGFNIITILVPNQMDHTKKSFTIESEFQKIALNIKEIESIGHEIKYICEINETISLNTDYTVFDEKRNLSYLRVGRIVRTELFEMMFEYYGDDLGFTYDDEKTVFKVWSPVAKELELELIDTAGIRQFIDFTYDAFGVWSVSVFGNLDGFKYRYRVRVNESFKTTKDPYAMASNANGEYNYVVDETKFYEFKHQKPNFSGKKSDAFIYEMHVRDMTISETSKAINKGLYDGLTENLDNEGLNHVKDLGITHVQLLPVYDFEGTDEVQKDKFYNWGYNPSQYNVVEGWFSKKPDDPYERINELRALVDHIHDKGMRVNMDVVYNHVFDMTTFPFETLVPGYYFRFDQHGMRTEVSGCGNDLASEKIMVQRFILNSIKHWMTYFGISGFRFDLMGLLDIETMNKVNQLVLSIDDKGFVYGEGWMMENTLPNKLRSHMGNHQFMPQISHFNDQFRDKIKGGTFSNTPGFALGGKISPSDLFYLFSGSAVDKFLFFNPTQSINYVECHDNHTFSDFARMVRSDLDETQIKDYAGLALGLVILSAGIPFIHAGQEFLRNKKGVENSYKSSDSINQIDWTLREKHIDLVHLTKDLIELRKKHKVFRFSQVSSIKQYIRLIESNPLTKTAEFKLSSFDGTFRVFFKNDYNEELLKVGPGYKTIFDGKQTVNDSANNFLAKKPGTYIFLKEKSDEI
ncbi:MAG TPA: type I pullulanase [Acholeplasma sp.]|nr:type I pullulanase [Acholeplasma sp.]